MSGRTEIGQYRIYHFRHDGGRCDCGEKYAKDCRYSVPSVTTILKYGVAKEWLGAWAAKMTAEYIADNIDTWGPAVVANRDAALRLAKGAPWRKRDLAADRGQDVHTAAEQSTPLELVPEAAQTRYQQYLNFLTLYRPVIRWQEATVYDFGHGYAGSFDLIADIGDETLLIDIKTSKAVYQEYRLQQAAYRYGQFIGGTNDRILCPVPRVDGAAILHLTETTFQLLRIEAGRREYRAFLAAKTLHDFVKSSEKEPLGELVLPQLKEEVA